MSWLGGRSAMGASPLDSEAFRRWFGNSVVVNPDGSPRVVYHGTSRRFDVFDATRYGESTDAGTLGAGFYFTSLREAAESYAKSDAEKTGEDPVVLEVYLRILSPYRAPKRIWDMSSDLKRAKKHSAGLKKQGFDGVVFDVDMVVSGYESFTEYVVFDPRQIKSVNNRRTWDGSDPNILHGWRR